MTAKFRTFLVLCALVCTVIATGLFLVAVNQIIGLLGGIHPLLGRLAFWTMLSGLVGIALYGAMLYLKLPPPLKPPAQTSGPEYDRYLSALAERLSNNPKLRGQKLRTADDINSALEILSKDADRAIRNTASTVFLATALMQNGRLDGVVVFGTQIRMVWRLARLYFQRPSFRHMGYLYLNVSVTALLSANLEDLDFAQIAAPFFTSLLPALPGALPLGGISDLFVRCVSHGAANAFLTLRVGEVARQYCEAVSIPDQAAIRRSATLAALGHLKRIVLDNSTVVIMGFGGLTGLIGKAVWHKLWPWAGGAAETVE